MLHRERTLPPAYICPVDEWKIMKKQFDLGFLSQIPEALEGFRFPLTIRGQELEVNIEKDQVTYLLRKGSELVLTHWGEELVLSVGEPCTAKLTPRAEER